MPGGRFGCLDAGFLSLALLTGQAVILLREGKVDDDAEHRTEQEHQHRDSAGCAVVFVVQMLVQAYAIDLYNALGVFLPLITTNCAVLGVAVTNMQKGYNFIESVLNAVGGAAGFALAIILFAGIRERIADNETPKAFDGFPMALITAGLMSIAFLGFSGLIKL